LEKSMPNFSPTKQNYLLHLHIDIHLSASHNMESISISQLTQLAALFLLALVLMTLLIMHIVKLEGIYGKYSAIRLSRGAYESTTSTWLLDYPSTASASTTSLPGNRNKWLLGSILFLLLGMVFHNDYGVYLS